MAVLCDGSALVAVRIHATGDDTTLPCPGCDNCLSHKEMYGHCEDAPCCGCCGQPADAHDSGMTKDDYMELYADPDYDPDFDFTMNG